MLTAGLGFSRADRDENVRRIGFVADLLSRNGVDVVCSVISPYRAARDEVRARHAESTPDDPDRFVEVWVSTPVDVCAEPRREGPLRRAARGRDRGPHRCRRSRTSRPSRPRSCCPPHELDLDDCRRRCCGGRVAVSDDLDTRRRRSRGLSRHRSRTSPRPRSCAGPSTRSAPTSASRHRWPTPCSSTWRREVDPAHRGRVPRHAVPLPRDAGDGRAGRGALPAQAHGADARP